MPTYSTPGVYVQESPLVSLTTIGGGTTAAMFFGEAPRGPITPTLVTDWPTFKSFFGDLDNNYELGYSVYHYFANGGRAAWINRVVGAGSTAATASVPFYPQGLGGASASLFTATANSPGTWGNNLTLNFITGNVVASTTAKPSFSLSIQLGGVEVEKWLELSPDINNNRYFLEMLNKFSKFIVVSNPNSFTASTSPASAGTVYFTTAPVALSGGTTVAVGTTDYTSAFPNADLIPGNLLMNAVGITSSTVISSLVNYAGVRGDSFVIIDPSKNDLTFAQTQTTAANFASQTNPGYGALYAPTLEMVDPAKTGPAAIRTTYPGGAVAGVYVRTELARTVAKSPAGFNATINGALGLTYKLTDSQVGLLYDGTPPVNLFKAVPGAGVYINGGRTLTKLTPDKYINVRRTLNYLKKNLKDITAFAAFEPNDANLWSNINVTVSSFLANFWRQGGLKGDRSNDAFFIVCDATNNTAQSIDAGQVNVSVGVALSYPAEFIIITLSQWTGGSNALDSVAPQP